MTRVRAALLAIGFGGLVGVAPPPAYASCAGPIEPVRLATHELVFVGQVVDTSDDDRVAEVRVLDVWRGRDLPQEVVVFGGVGNGRGSSSVDRVFADGQTYAFFPYVDEEGVLRDSICTPTAPLSERVALDPPGVRPPRADAPAVADPRTPTWMWLAGGAAVVTSGMLAAAVRGTRRAITSGSPDQAL